MEELIRFEHLIKVYPPNVVAVDDVSLSFRQGEIHAVIGENGAGKSTLMKVLYGLVPRDAGEIYYRGQAVRFRQPGEAIAHGIGMVHQEILLIPEYTVWQNIVLGLEPVSWFGRIDEKKARQLVQRRIDEFQFNLDPDALVGEISISARQKVEILKLLYRQVSVLILDEPTSVLTPQEVPQLFAELKRLRDRGHTILFISHRLDEVLALSERITVMRRGKHIQTVAAADTNKVELARMMVGRDVIFTSRRSPGQSGRVHQRTDPTPVFEVSHLSYKDSEGRTRLEDVSLKVHAGEIVGVAGVEGNGQLELVNTIIGLSQPSFGRISVQGQDLAGVPILDRRRWISFVPQDRYRMGASAKASILENAIMTHHRLDQRFSRWRGLLLNYTFARRFTSQIEQQFAVSMASQDSSFSSLSGGNQQKVILGRELLLPSPFVLLDQPTRGLDVGSMEYIHQQILAMRAEGRAVLMISADLEELFLIADRIVVLHRGRLVADLSAESTSIEEIGYYMLEGRARPG